MKVHSSHQAAREGEEPLRVGKRQGGRGGPDLLGDLLLAALALLCLGIFLLSLGAATTSEVPGVPLSLALEGADVEHVDREANDPASNLPLGSYPFTPFEELQETDKLPLNSSVLTRLVQALASFLGAASVSWVLMTNARGRGSLVCSGIDDGGWLAAKALENPSFLGVFRL